jgi:hypothetical protein
MRVSPRPLAPIPAAWADFQGIVPIGLEQMTQIFPGFSAADRVALRIPVAPLVGHMQVSELAVLVNLVRTLGATSFAEIGTFDGLTILNLLENCPALQSVYTVDLPDEIVSAKGIGSVFPIDSVNASMIGTVRIGDRFRSHSRREIVTQLREDSAHLSVRDLPSEIEVFLIDGSHNYDYCLSDSRLAQNAVGRTGLVIWHDYANVKYLPGVTQALLQVAREGEMNLYWLDDPQLRTSLVFGMRR